MRVKLNDQAVQELLSLLPHYSTSNPSHVVNLAITELYKQLNTKQANAHLSEASDAIEKQNLYLLQD